MNTKIFSYKVTGIVLKPETEGLKISDSFDRKTVLDELREKLKAENFKVDDTSLSYKLIDDQLYIQGMAVANEEPKTVGFQFGK